MQDNNQQSHYNEIFGYYVSSHSIKLFKSGHNNRLENIYSQMLRGAQAVFEKALPLSIKKPVPNAETGFFRSTITLAPQGSKD
jgi:hypothetical protein